MVTVLGERHASPPVTPETSQGPAEYFAGLSTIEIDDRHGWTGLRLALGERIARPEVGISPEDQAGILEVADMATALHMGQKRSDGDGTYQAHPLRATLEMLQYGVSEPPLLKSMLMHDTVEDQAQALVVVLGGDIKHCKEMSGPEVQAYALSLMAKSSLLGADVADIVRGVTMAKYDPACGMDKPTWYAAETRLIYEHPDYGAVKLFDNWDNACNNHRTLSPLRTKLDGKYLPNYAHCLDFLDRETPYLSDESRRVLREVFTDGYRRCQERLIAKCVSDSALEKAA